MATLAQIFDRFTARNYRAADPEIAARPYIDTCRLRMFPNEDVYFFVKRIDNSNVIRVADPKTRRACWRAIGVSVAASVVFVGLLLPGVYSLLAGYKIETLRQDHARLQVEKSALELQETKLLSPQRLEELARMQRFVDPAPNRVVHLDGKPEGTLALR